jgi:ethylbenzene dioxygenase beta subunit
MSVATGNVDDKTLKEVVEFLIKEAEVLDNHKYFEWLEMLADDIEYVMPVRITREKTEEELKKELSDSQYHFIGGKDILEMKAKRLVSEYAWSENPPSRTRHLITNIRVEKGEKDNEVKVKSYVLFIRSRRDEAESEILSYERHDVLRKVNGKWKLAKRFMISDFTVIPLRNLDNFL